MPSFSILLKCAPCQHLSLSMSSKIRLFDNGKINTRMKQPSKRSLYVLLSPPSSWRCKCIQCLDSCFQALGRFVPEAKGRNPEISNPRTGLHYRIERLLLRPLRAVESLKPQICHPNCIQQCYFCKTMSPDGTTSKPLMVEGSSSLNHGRRVYPAARYPHHRRVLSRTPPSRSLTLAGADSRCNIMTAASSSTMARAWRSRCCTISATVSIYRDCVAQSPLHPALLRRVTVQLLLRGLPNHSVPLYTEFAVVHSPLAPQCILYRDSQLSSMSRTQSLRSHDPHLWSVLWIPDLQTSEQ